VFVRLPSTAHEPHPLNRADQGTAVLINSDLSVNNCCCLTVAIIIGQKSRQQLVSGGDRADTLKAKLLDQAILQGLVGALDAALLLRRIGAQNVDVERVQRAPELGHAVTLDCLGAIDPKDAVLVAVERDRLAMRVEILAGRLEVVEG
jgi:hypothetical protein